RRGRPAPGRSVAGVAAARGGGGRLPRRGQRGIRPARGRGLDRDPPRASAGRRASVALPPRLDLTATAPDLSRFPRRAVMAAFRRTLAEMPDAALDYGDPRGDDVLRA